MTPLLAHKFVLLAFIVHRGLFVQFDVHWEPPVLRLALEV